jgi:hypothetical protein
MRHEYVVCVQYKDKKFGRKNTVKETIENYSLYEIVNNSLHVMIRKNRFT